MACCGTEDRLIDPPDQFKGVGSHVTPEWKTRNFHNFTWRCKVPLRPPVMAKG